MKKIITCAALLLISAISFGQDNYTVKMNMKIDGLPPEYAAMGETETVTYLKGEKNKTEISGMMGTQIAAFDGKMHTFLNDQMGNKTGYTATKEEMEAGDKNKTEKKPKVEYTTQKKMIAGYECTKALVIASEKEQKDTITVWVTDKIKSDAPKGKKRGMMDLGDLKGFPLEMSMQKSQQGTDIKILITASEISTKPLSDDLFKVSTEGYTMSSYKEAMEKMKTMGRQ